MLFSISGTFHLFGLWFINFSILFRMFHVNATHISNPNYSFTKYHFSSISSAYFKFKRKFLMLSLKVFFSFISFQDNKTFYFVLGLCHAVALSSSFTNPVMYGWFNTSLRSELETLLPKAFRSNCLKRSVPLITFNPIHCNCSLDKIM